MQSNAFDKSLSKVLNSNVFNGTFPFFKHKKSFLSNETLGKSKMLFERNLLINDVICLKISFPNILEITMDNNWLVTSLEPLSPFFSTGSVVKCSQPDVHLYIR